MNKTYYKFAAVAVIIVVAGVGLVLSSGGTDEDAVTPAPVAPVVAE